MRIFTTALLALSGLLAGCNGPAEELAPVAGRVTVAGKPLTTGRIMFHPEQGRPALGAIGPDGKFELTTYTPGDGARVGKHRVTITARETIGGSGPRSFDEEMQGVPFVPGETRLLVPAEYADVNTTPLQCEVQPEKNDFKFELP